MNKMILVIVIVFFLFPVIASASIFIPLGSGEEYTYNNVPFEVWALCLCVGIQQDSFIERNVIDIPEYEKIIKIHLLQTATHAADIPDGALAGHMNTYYKDGSFETMDVVFGENIAEWAYDRYELQHYLGHTKIDPAYSYLTDSGSQYFFWGHKFYTLIDVDPKKMCDYLELVYDCNESISIVVQAVTLEISRGVNRCINLKDSPLVNKKVILKQPFMRRQTTITDDMGCYEFEHVVPWIKGKLIIKVPSE